MDKLEGSRRGGRTLAREAASQIKRYILANNLRTGDPLPSETELCDNLGISRSSVREAIRALNTLEIVDVQHGRGTFVGHASLQPLVETLAFRAMMVPGDDFKALREVVSVRESLDLSEAEPICTSLSGSNNEGLHALVDEMCAAAARGDSFLEQDREFHTTLLNLAGLEILSQLVAAFWDVHTAVLPSLTLPNAADFTAIARAHGDMLRAAEAGDVEAYREAVRAHYRPLREMLQQSAH